jgi:Immunity protein Imm5
MPRLIPQELEEMINELLVVILNNPRKALPPYYRRKIYSFNVHDQGFNSRFCVWLEVFTTYKVIEYWKSEMIPGYSPRDILDIAVSVICGRMDIYLANFKREWSSAILDANGEEDGDLTNTKSYFVAKAAHESLRTAFGNEPFNNVLIDPAESDTDLDYTCSDAALYAAQVYSGISHSDDLDVDRCQEFWTWWLTEAVPNAWHEAQLT